MRKLSMLLVFFILLGGSLPVFSQWSLNFTEFPGGYLRMSYRVTTEERVLHYTIELTPKGNGLYTVRTEIAGETTLDELKDAGLFFSWSTSLWLAEAWWFPFYSMIFATGGPLQPGKTYVFMGITLETEPGYVDIAGVRAVKGVLTIPDNPNQRVVLAVSPDPRVPYPVLVRTEEATATGTWEPSFEVILVEYLYRAS